MRGVSGAVILGVPLIYTQEVWFHGGNLSPEAILGLMVASFGLNLALSNVVGFRAGRTHRPFEDAIVGFGLSFVLATLLLGILNRIALDTGWGPNLGIIAISAVPLSLGFALGNAMAPAEGGPHSEELNTGLGDVLAAAAGAVLVALNIAPTEEPLLLATEIGWGRLVLLVILSLVLSYLIVFYAEFNGRSTRTQADQPIHSPLIETMLCYLVALAMSGLMLLTFEAIQGIDGFSLARIVVLGFPASMGSSLGRLLV
jgi:putative integral membrane protein (TIGR02587 family)